MGPSLAWGFTTGGSITALLPRTYNALIYTRLQ